MGERATYAWCGTDFGLRLGQAFPLERYGMFGYAITGRGALGKPLIC